MTNEEIQALRKAIDSVEAMRETAYHAGFEDGVKYERLGAVKNVGPAASELTQHYINQIEVEKLRISGFI